MANIFQQNKEILCGKWIDSVFRTYPLETTAILRTGKDRFTNPVGYATRESLSLIYDLISGVDMDESDITQALEAFVRIRAVQDFTPSKALGVLYQIKPILRDFVKQLPKGVDDFELFELLRDSEDRIDTLALLAFDLYVEFKNVMYRGNIDEIRRKYKNIERWIATQGMDGVIPADECSGDDAGNK